MSTTRGIFAFVLMLFASSASATLTSSFQFNGNGNWSIDGTGSLTSEQDLRALVPTGSTVEQAFLYQSTFRNTLARDITFDGTLISGTSWTNLGTATGQQLTAFRTDVTSQVSDTVGNGNAAPFTFSVTETNTNQDGTALVVVYSNPDEDERTIALLDGFSDQTGDTTTINLSSEITAGELADPDLELALSLGIGFSFQTLTTTDQFSTVNVNNERLTSSAGGQDDGFAADGALITIGDIFDDDFSSNPMDPFSPPTAGPRTDDEAYNLVPFITAGDSQIFLNTANPSFDDNIFFAGLNLTLAAGVNQPPPIDDGTNPDPIPVSEPTSLALFSIGLMGMLVRSRFKC